jgi:glycosyltransferase involved in cell wall biosynthesis
MKRVAHIVFSLEPGGMENGVVNLCNRLGPEFASSVYCLRRRGAFADRLQPGVPVRMLGFPDRFTPLGVMRLGFALRKDRPHVVHTHNLGPLLYGALALRIAGLSTPLVHGEHSALSEADLKPRRLAQRRRFYRSAWAVHTVSNALVEDLRAHGLGHPRMRAVVNGVDAARFHADTEARLRVREELGIPADAPVVGMVGRFGAFKRHALLLEAFASLGAEAGPMRLLLVGGGGPLEREVLARVSAHPHRDRIVATGFRPDPAPLYAAMDLLVVPSVNEGLSNALLEAMACGVPVLTHPACGAQEVVRSGVDGLVTALDSPEALAAALRAFLAERAAWRARGDRAQESVRGRFSLETMVFGYKSMYSEAVYGA